MIEDGPSLTALQVAAARAAHILFDPAPHLLDDRPALDLLGPEHASMVDGYRDEGSWMLLENRVSIPLRARYVEDRLAEAYATGMRQLVTLGAGVYMAATRNPGQLNTPLRTAENQGGAPEGGDTVQVEGGDWWNADQDGAASDWPAGGDNNGEKAAAAGSSDGAEVWEK